MSPKQVFAKMCQGKLHAFTDQIKQKPALTMQVIIVGKIPVRFQKPYSIDVIR
jgi:hypothetical protein